MFVKNIPSLDSRTCLILLNGNENKGDTEVSDIPHERLPDRIVLSKFTCYGMERTSVSGVKLTEGACGPLYKSIMIEGECPGLTEHGMRCEVKLYNGQPRRESA